MQDGNRDTYLELAFVLSDLSSPHASSESEKSSPCFLRIPCPFLEKFRLILRSVPTLVNRSPFQNIDKQRIIGMRCP